MRCRSEKIPKTGRFCNSLPSRWFLKVLRKFGDLLSILRCKFITCLGKFLSQRCSESQSFSYPYSGSFHRGEHALAWRSQSRDRWFIDRRTRGQEFYWQENSRTRVDCQRGSPGSVGLMQSIPPSVGEQKDRLSKALWLCVFSVRGSKTLSRFILSQAVADTYMEISPVLLSKND